MSEKILNTKKEYKITEGKVYINTEKPFVSIDTEKEGILITPVDKPVENKVCYALSYRSRAIYIPPRIMRAYAMGHLEIAYYLEDGRVFIPKERKQLVKPLNECIIKAVYNAELKNRSKKTKAVHTGRISLSKEEHRGLGTDIKIEIVNNDRQYIRLSAASEEEINELPTYDMIRNEYGPNLLLYPYDTLQYIFSCNNTLYIKNGHISSFTLPMIFTRAWNLDIQDNRLIAFKQNDGSVIFTPQKICYIDKKEIPAAKEKPAEKLVCEHCYDPSENPDELKTAILLIKEIAGACKKINETNKALQKENERLNQRIENIEKVFGYMNAHLS